jgi:hypothetical protein
MKVSTLAHESEIWAITKENRKQKLKMQKLNFFANEADCTRNDQIRNMKTREQLNAFNINK